MSYDQRPTKIRVVKDRPEPGTEEATPGMGAPGAISRSGSTVAGVRAPGGGAAASGAKAAGGRAGAGTARGGAVVPGNAAATASANAVPLGFWLIGGSLFLVASAIGGAAAMAIFH